MNESGFSGTTSECMKHLFENHEWELVRPCLASFSQVDGQTVRHWYKEENAPVGPSLLKVRVFLDLLGYRVEEFYTLPDVTKDFSRLIVFGHISFQDARKTLNYVDDKGLFDIVLRAKSAQRDRIYRLERFVENSSNELDRLKQKFKKQIRDELQLGDEQDASEEECVGALAIVSASDRLRAEEPIVAAVVTVIASADAVISLLDFDSQADELVVKIAEMVDFADLRSLIASLEVIESVVTHGSLENR